MALGDSALALPFLGVLVLIFMISFYHLRNVADRLARVGPEASSLARLFKQLVTSYLHINVAGIRIAVVSSPLPTEGDAGDESNRPSTYCRVA